MLLVSESNQLQLLQKLQKFSGKKQLGKARKQAYSFSAHQGRRKLFLPLRENNFNLLHPIQSIVFQFQVSLIILHFIYSHLVQFFMNEINIKYQLSDLDLCKILGGSILIRLFFYIRSQINQQESISKEMLKQIQSQKMKVNQLRKMIYTKSKKKTNSIFLIDNISTPPNHKEALQIRFRELPIHVKKKNVKYEHISGGSFDFHYNNENFIATINDTTVLSSILIEKSKKVSIFKKMTPVVKEGSFFLWARGFSMVGILSYDFELKKFKIQPFIMGANVYDIIAHYEFQISWGNFKKGSSFLLLGGLALFLLWSPIKKIIKRLKNKTNENEVGDFQKGEFLKICKQSIYICLKCKKNIANMVYNCGHISVCQSCYNQQQQKNAGKTNFICPACHKESNKFLKIFFG